MMRNDRKTAILAILAAAALAGCQGAPAADPQACARLLHELREGSYPTVPKDADRDTVNLVLLHTDASLVRFEEMKVALRDHGCRADDARFALKAAADDLLARGKANSEKREHNRRLRSSGFRDADDRLLHGLIQEAEQRDFGRPGAM